MTRTVFTGGQVVDGTGSAPFEADVLVQHGEILEIGTGLDGDAEVPCAGRTLLPGLFDCHVHVVLRSVDTAERLQTPFSYPYYHATRHLSAMRRQGITHARDAAGADLGVKQALEEGLIAGPRLQIAITMISQTGGHADGWHASGNELYGRIAHPGRPHGVADGPDEVRRKVREVVRAGADVIKIASSGGVMSPRDNPRHAHYGADELEIAVAEAAAAGLGVMAHAQGANGIKNALRAGVRSIEHGIHLDDEAIDLLLERDAFLVPTLSAPLSVIEAAANGARLTEASLAKAHAVLEAHANSFRRAVEAGVKIAMGTDAVGSAPGRNLEELKLMHRFGQTPAQVLRSTTLVGAQLLGVDEHYGTLRPGKRADLVVVSGDPLDFHDLQARVESVWMDGILVEDRTAAASVTA
ncbi:amidohydrolase family protein [Amycolatopsis sp. NPDC098790]|uniref:metal-dependent hydrolase family protein n=1 Tax=Amycolatopsis sp. NPDC098790 TaxID=3363939 RepID=UPI00381A3277